ncbi:MAG: choline-sulfatase [Acetobacter syzygii]|uniref:choline-sulfatase n=1 Tax=Acetobacter syzygii TaxID=146476 RepID=UPI0039E80903
MRKRSGLPPNFLVVVADQLTASVLPALLGGRDPSVVKVPTLSKLARSGTVFANAYTPSPLCGPARSALMTGLLPSHNHVYDNGCEWHADIPTFGHRLRLAGYQTILAGKMHFVGADQLHGFEERLTTDIYPADFTWVPDWTNRTGRPDWYHSMDSVLNAGPVLRSNQLDFDEEVAFATRRKLYDLARAGTQAGQPQRPFCLVTSFTHPHDPFNITPQWWDLYENTPIPLPRVAAPCPTHPAELRIREACGINAAPPADADILRARRAYYGAISYVDHQLRQLLDTLAETGLDKTTAVVFTSDHGEMLGEHGQWYKMSFREGACRVPLIIALPGQQTPHRITQAVSLADVGETLCALAHAPAAPQTHGRDLSACLRGNPLEQDEIFGEYLGEGTFAPTVMIRRGRWKFVHTPEDPNQLYDVQQDADETRNLAGQPEHAQTEAAFLNEVQSRWNLNTLHSSVLASQQRRALVKRALATGRCTPWDYQPPANAHRQYIRNHKPLEQLEAEARLPYPRNG